MNAALFGMLLTMQMLQPAQPKFCEGEITQLAYADRKAVVIRREWGGPLAGWSYTVVPAELVFPRGTP
jgi:hypothetical protein